MGRPDGLSLILIEFPPLDQSIARPVPVRRTDVRNHGEATREGNAMRQGLLFALSATLLVPRAGVAGAQDNPLPLPAPGWTIELAAQGGQITTPTALVSAPDGTVYLGQDGTVVTFKDGRITVFADKLGRIHGLEWIDGTLLVAHGPFLSALRDTDGDGRADDREDLVTGLEPKLTGAVPAGDQCMGGIRLGLDGLLYMAVGDQGIPPGRGQGWADDRVSREEE